MTDRTEPYKALTRLHLPVIERDYNPGEEVSIDDLNAAEQSDESIEALVGAGVLGEADAELHYSTIIPSPDMPTIQRVVEESKAVVAEMKLRGDEVPAELEAVANLDYVPVVTNDEGKAGDASA